MGEIKTRTNHIRAWIKRGWGLSLVGATLVVLALFGGTNAWASPRGDRPNQTVPQPTITSPATAVPTVTPTSPPPTDTPQPPAATATPDSPTATSQPGAPTATHTPTPPPTATPTPELTATEVPGFALQAQMDVVSGLAMQGDEAEIRLVILNPGSIAAQNVMVRDELPDGLQVVAVDAAGGTAATEVGSNGRTVALFTWPALDPGVEAQATLTVRIDPNLADGVVIDNLAVAYADNAGPATVGVSIGMPPVLLPTFD